VKVSLFEGIVDSLVVFFTEKKVGLLFLSKVLRDELSWLVSYLVSKLGLLGNLKCFLGILLFDSLKF
jgi:hypothetical protein